jgi:hypothetical protein
MQNIQRIDRAMMPARFAMVEVVSMKQTQSIFAQAVTLDPTFVAIMQQVAKQLVPHSRRIYGFDVRHLPAGWMSTAFPFFPSLVMI